MKKDPRKLLKEYLKKTQVIQLATAKDNQPWVCNIHFVADEDNNIYWVSKSFRRHSQEIKDNPKTALGIMVKGPEHPVIGIQIEGNTVLVEDSHERQKAMELYDQRYKVSQDFFNGVVVGTAKELLYKLTPQNFVLFDEEQFPDDPRQEWPSGD